MPPGLCVCASLHDGTTQAQLEDWLRFQRCAGVSFVGLSDSRILGIEEKLAFNWTTHSWIQSDFLHLLPPASCDASSSAAARRPLEHSAADHCRELAAKRSSCAAVAFLEAPFEVVSRTDDDIRALPPPGVARRVNVVSYYRPPPSSPPSLLSLPIPPRPLAVEASLRAALQPADDVAALLVGVGGDNADGVADTTADIELLSTVVRRYSRLAADTAEDASRNASWVSDHSGQSAQKACDAMGESAGPFGHNRLPPQSPQPPQPPQSPHPSSTRSPQPADATDAWIEAAAHAVSDGDGITLLRAAVSSDEAKSIRDAILSAVPPSKFSTRVFANHMCQIHRGVAQSPGLDQTCEPLVRALMNQLPLHPTILKLARRLLGDGFRLHNAGLSLVSSTPPLDASLLASPSSIAQAAAGRLAAATPHQDLPINAATVWDGRVPPPSHALSLQALWLLDDFTFDNGATYVIPRSQQRTEHIDRWANEVGSGGERDGEGGGRDEGRPPPPPPQSRGALAAASGLLPTRIVTGSAGDVLLALGSLWHAPSTSAAGASPRLALLFEFAPSFVEPRDLYSAALVRRLVHSEEHRRIFPTIDQTCAHARPEEVKVESGGNGGGQGMGGGDGGGASGCDENGDVLSVHEWRRFVEERPHCLSIRSRVLLRGGRLALPVFGLGTGSPDDSVGATSQAIRAGHRLIDTGELYGNEQIIRDAIRVSGVHPETMVLSSKAGTWCAGELPADVAAAVPDEYRSAHLGGLYPIASRGTLGRGVCIGDARSTRAAFNATLTRLGVQRLSVYLLHWPLTHAAYELGDARHASMRLDAWRELLRLRQLGLASAVGVSNFSPRLLRELIAATGEPPDLVQVEMHLLLQQPELRALCDEHGIFIQAYGHHKPEIAQHRLPVEAAKALGAGGAALLSMRWALQVGAGIIPRSRRVEYVATNKRVFHFALPREALPILKAADQNRSLYGLHEVFVRDEVR